MNIRPYLSFNGNCREAIELYSKAFGTSASDVVKYADMPQTPGGPEITEEMKEWVLQAMLTIGDNFIRMSDSMKGVEAPSGRVAVVVECTEEEVKQAFSVLSEEGKIDMPLQRTFFSPLYGIVVDKFGVMWNLAAME